MDWLNPPPNAGLSNQNHVVTGVPEAIAISEALQASWQSRVVNGPVEIEFEIYKASEFCLTYQRQNCVVGLEFLTLTN